VLGAGVAATGLVTFAYFAVAGHVLAERPYARVALLWSVVSIAITVLYRPVEQLLSRRIASGSGEGHPLRSAILVSASAAALFLVLAVALRVPLEDGAFDGSAQLYAICLVATVAYAGSYVARGWLAGHGNFAFYGVLVFCESTCRFAFALAVALGLAHGEVAVALGIAVAPVLSLGVVVVALAGHARIARATPGGRLRDDAGFAGAAFAIQLAEQALVGGAVLVVEAAGGGPALAGRAFNVLLIARAPLVLFQAVQAALLPHLASGGDEREAIRPTLLLVAAFSAVSVLVLLAIGPWLMHAAFGPDLPYARGGLALVAVGMGFHLAAGTLTQRRLASGQAARTAVAWLGCAVLFLLWLAVPIGDQSLLRVEIGYCVATALLAAAMAR
jgi:O-antigen/teichoic acid export membrane protein